MATVSSSPVAGTIIGPIVSLNAFPFEKGTRIYMTVRTLHRPEYDANAPEGNKNSSLFFPIEATVWDSQRERDENGNAKPQIIERLKVGDTIAIAVNAVPFRYQKDGQWVYQTRFEPAVRNAKGAYVLEYVNTGNRNNEHTDTDARLAALEKAVGIKQDEPQLQSPFQTQAAPAPDFAAVSQITEPVNG